MTAQPPQPPPPVFPPPAAMTHLDTRTDRFTAWIERGLARAPRWLGPLGGACGVGMAVGYTFVVHTTSRWDSEQPTCLLRLLTGFDCPGCGGTRSAWYLMHGDIAAAAWHHAPFVFAVPFLVYMYVVWSLNTAFGLRLPQLRLSTRSILVFMAAWGVFSVLRNLPWEPFTFLYV